MQILRLNERLNLVLPIILNDISNLTFKAFWESTYFSTRQLSNVSLLCRQRQRYNSERRELCGNIRDI
jgi:hypothetical protein